jgi:hypothetical protein
VIAPEQAAASSDDGFGSEGGQLTGPVRFVEGPVRNAVPAKTLETLVDAAFVSGTADDEMRMRKRRR